jgi:L-lactate dehydrogenase complex protein LldE
MAQESQKPEKVYYFGTCLMDSIYPQAGLAGLKLIQREGVQVIYPRQQSCCGQPAYNSGFPKEAKKVALKQVRLFAEDYPIVVPSGSCAGMMKHHYPLLFESDKNLQRVRQFSERVVELSEFLVQTLHIQLADRGQPIKVTWHSSCHAMREMHVIEYSKSLIRQLQNVELVELQNEHECCGFGGTFAIKQPKISGTMVGDKVADIRQTGAERLLAGDCGCLMNISGAMDYQSVPIRSQHLAEFIWERTNAT